MTPRDVEAVAAAVPSISEISREYAYGGVTLQAADRTHNISISAVDADYQYARNCHPVPGGRFISERDNDTRRRVVVLGDDIRRRVFGDAPAIGREIQLWGRPFKVIGVLGPVGLAGGAGSALVGRDLNNDVHIPLPTAVIQFGDTVIRRQTGQIHADFQRITSFDHVHCRTHSRTHHRVRGAGAGARRRLHVHFARQFIQQMPGIHTYQRRHCVFSPVIDYCTIRTTTA